MAVVAKNTRLSNIIEKIGSLNNSNKDNELSAQSSNRGLNDRIKKKVCIIGCSGSVATVKVPELALSLAKNFHVLIVCTKNAHFFLERSKLYNPVVWEEFLAIGGLDLIFEDKDEWIDWNSVGDEVLHIELRRVADLLVVAPASADFLAKASLGICDNLLLSLVKAWDYTKPCFLCPAMNTLMWSHPITGRHLEVLKGLGFGIIPPIEKKLACQDVGNGAMNTIEVITNIINGAQLLRGNSNEETHAALKSLIDVNIAISRNNSSSSMTSLVGERRKHVQFAETNNDHSDKKTNLEDHVAQVGIKKKEVHPNTKTNSSNVPKHTVGSPTKAEKTSGNEDDNNTVSKRPETQNVFFDYCNDLMKIAAEKVIQGLAFGGGFSVAFTFGMILSGGVLVAIGQVLDSGKDETVSASYRTFLMPKITPFTQFRR